MRQICVSISAWLFTGYETLGKFLTLSEFQTCLSFRVIRKIRKTNTRLVLSAFSFYCCHSQHDPFSLIRQLSFLTSKCATLILGSKLLCIPIFSHRMSVFSWLFLCPPKFYSSLRAQLRTQFEFSLPWKSLSNIPPDLCPLTFPNEWNRK